MNIYQRIILVIGGIGVAFVIFVTMIEVAYKDNVLVMLMTSAHSFILAIAYSAIVGALTFSLYVGFKSRKSD